VGVVDCKECRLVKTLNDIFPKGEVERISTSNYWLVPGFECRSSRPVLSKHPIKYTSSHPTPLALKQCN
jgi:hypothetical protein